MNKVRKLIERINELPGIGKKASERMAVDLVEGKMENLELFREIIKELETMDIDLRTNTIISDGEITPIKEGKPLLILLTNVEVIRFREMLKDNFNYYNLRINKPSQISKRLIDRILYKNIGNIINNNKINELIFGLSNRADSEIIIRTITNELLRDHPELKISRLATGIPVGSSVLHIDEETIRKATKNRESI